MKQKKRNVGSVRSRAELLNLQRSFAGAIRRPLRKDDTMLSWKDAAAMIAPSRHLSPHSRLELYAQQYWWRLEDSFDEDFVTLARVLAPAQYHSLRENYLATCHSRFFSLRNLGEQLPAFIRRQKSPNLPAAALAHDCACFDWARIVSFDAASFSPLRLTDVTAPDFSETKIFLQPHVQLLPLGFPVDRIVKQCVGRDRADSSNAVVAKGRIRRVAAPISLQKSPTFLVLHRFQEQVFMKRVSVTAFQILRLFRDGCSLSELMRKRSVSSGARKRELPALLQEWVSLGWLYLR